MPYVEFNLDASGALSRLKTIQQRVGNVRPLYNSIGEYLLQQARERFDTTEASPQGSQWKPLSARYKRWKDKVKPGGKILSLRGNLKSSLGYRLVGDSVVVGTVKGVAPKYAKIHQYGGAIRQKPRTQVIPVDERGLFMSRKAAGKRKGRKSTRIHIANIGQRTITIPARPYVGINDRDRERIKRDALKYLVAHEG